VTTGARATDATTITTKTDPAITVFHLDPLKVQMPIAHQMITLIATAGTITHRETGITATMDLLCATPEMIATIATAFGLPKATSRSGLTSRPEFRIATGLMTPDHPVIGEIEGPTRARKAALEGITIPGEEVARKAGVTLAVGRGVPLLLPSASS